MPEVTFNYMGENVEVEGRILSTIIKNIKGTKVRVTPCNDEYIAKFGIWIKGELTELVEVKVKLDKELEDSNIKFHSLEWHSRMEQGK